MYMFAYDSLSIYNWSFEISCQIQKLSFCPLLSYLMKQNVLADKLVQNPMFPFIGNPVGWEMEIGMMLYP